MDHVDYVKRQAIPLRPEPTGVEPKLPRLPGIRAVIFDVYGTLIVSAAGDISLVSEESSQEGMVAALRHLGVEDPIARSTEALQHYEAGIIRQHEAGRSMGVEFPEVEIREVWESVAALSGGRSDRIAEAALIYECAVNPCWEMPGAGAVVDQLHEAGILLGIISNAQCYTEAVVEAVSGVSLSGKMFESDFSVFSYQLLEGKPSRRLFELAATAAAGRGVETREVLYVGNDFLKDIEPAGSVGFTTALFAGDRRSFRPGHLAPHEACAAADVVLTELRQLTEVLRLTP